MFVIVPISWGFWELIVVAAGFPLIGLVVCCVWSLYCVCWFSSLFLINDFCLSKKKKKKKKQDMKLTLRQSLIFIYM